MGVSRRAYARHRGVSDMAVRKAIASGRIVLEDDGTIDPVKPDRSFPMSAVICAASHDERSSSLGETLTY